MPKDETIDANTGETPSVTPPAETPATETNSGTLEAEVDRIFDANKAQEGEDDGQEAPPAPDETPAPVPDKPEEPPVEPKPEPPPENPDDVSKMPAHLQPRFKEVIEQRNAARTELENAKPVLENAKLLRDYTQKHNIAEGDINRSVELAGLYTIALRGNKEAGEAFLDALEQLRAPIEVRLGKRLEPDLAKQVEDGLLTPEQAKAETLSRQRTREFEARSKTYEEQQETAHRRSMAKVGMDWEAIQMKDPQYVAVKDHVEALIAVALDGKVPANTAECLRILEDSKTKALAYAKKFAPVPAPRKVLKTTGSSETQKADPQTFEEAMNEVFAQHGM